MKVVLYRSDKPREHRIFDALSKGVQAHGDQCEIRRTEDYGEGGKHIGPDGVADCTFFYGVKSKEKVRDFQQAGCNWGIIDKGYRRDRGPYRIELYSRISVNETYPIRYFEREKPRMPSDRWQRLGLELKPLRNTHDGHILVAGSSQKFYDYFSVGGERQYHQRCIAQIRKIIFREVKAQGHYQSRKHEIIYRPKPSYGKKMRMDDAEAKLLGADHFSDPHDSIMDALEGAHCLVTFASNAACDAIFAGVPAIVIGPHVTSGICSNSLKDIFKPRFPTLKERHRWACNMAYEQWTLAEMESGEAWEHLKPRVAFGQVEEEWYRFPDDQWRD